MTIHRVGYLACWIVCVGASLQAQAFQLSGSFSGTADAFELPLPIEPPSPISVFDGAVVTGSFAFDIPDPQLQALADNELAIFANGHGGTFDISFNVNGRRFNYAVASPPDEPGLLMLTSTPDLQALSLFSSPNTNNSAWLTLSGPPGSLFSEFDAATLHIDPTQSYRLQPSFRVIALDLGIDVNVTASRLNIATPIPEPTTVTLLLLGGALLAGVMRKRAVSRMGAYAI